MASALSLEPFHHEPIEIRAGTIDKMQVRKMHNPQWTTRRCQGIAGLDLLDVDLQRQNLIPWPDNRRMPAGTTDIAQRRVPAEQSQRRRRLRDMVTL